MALDLIVLVPDADWEATIDALLSRRQRALGIREIRYEIVRHPRRDPGVRKEAAELLRAQAGRAKRALVVLDVEGSGSAEGASVLKREIERSLSRAGWSGRCAVVAVAPELESWLWTGSPHVAHVLGWQGSESIRDWLRARSLWPDDDVKPPDPKGALRTVLRATGTRSSPALFRDLASRVGLSTCRDEGFARFRSTLQSWFGEE